MQWCDQICVLKIWWAVVWERKERVSLEAIRRTLKNNETQLTGANNGFDEVLALGMERYGQVSETLEQSKYYSLMVDWISGENLRDVLRALPWCFSLGWQQMWKNNRIWNTLGQATLYIFVFLILLFLWSCTESTYNVSFCPWNSVGSALTWNIDWHIWFAMSTLYLELPGQTWNVYNMWNIWKLMSKLKCNCHLIVLYLAIGLYDTDILLIIKKLFLGS